MTMTSLLKKLAVPGKPLRQEAFDAAEYAGLIHSSRVRLTDAQNPVNSLESRFDLAYKRSTCALARRCTGQDRDLEGGVQYGSPHSGLAQSAPTGFGRRMQDEVDSQSTRLSA